jgi:multidrug resistance protein MdtO
MAVASAVGRVWKPLEALFTEELAPRPGRLTASLRTAACCCLVTAVGMVFEIPDTEIAVFFVFLIAREDVVASVVAGLAVLVLTTLGLALALVPATFDSGEIALRLPIMVALTLGGMYASRAFKLGPAVMAAGFVLVKAQALLDQVPSTEAFVLSLLWMWVVVALPIAVVVLAQLATGELPGARIHRSGVAVLRSLADSLRHPGREDVRAEQAGAREVLTTTRTVAMVDATAKRKLGGDVRLIETLETLLAMRDVLPAETPSAVRERLADECAACADAFEHGRPVVPAPPVTDDRALASAPAGVLPVAFAMAGALDRLRDGLDRRTRGLAEPPGPVARPPLTDRGARQENFRYALKGTIAVMAAYLIYVGYGYFGISTAVSTAFYVSLGTLGESIQKLTRRITGALIGGVLGGLCIHYLQPSMTDIGHLSLLVGAVSGVCAWMAASPRLAYFAWQIALAFLLGVIQGHAPPSHFKVLLDRVVGILLGNVLVTLVFGSLWPTSARDRAEATIDRALRELPTLLGAGPPPAGARLAVLQAIDKARAFVRVGKFELRMIPEVEYAEARHGTSVSELQRIAGLTFVVAECPGSPAVAQSLRSANERTTKLLLARAGAAEVEIGPPIGVAVDPGATLSDRAAIEASALLSSELERADAVAS